MFVLFLFETKKHPFIRQHTHTHTQTQHSDPKHTKKGCTIHHHSGKNTQWDSLQQPRKMIQNEMRMKYTNTQTPKQIKSVCVCEWVLNKKLKHKIIPCLHHTHTTQQRQTIDQTDGCTHMCATLIHSFIRRKN